MDNISHWKFVTVEMKGPLLGELLAIATCTRLLLTHFLPLLDLPYDNDTSERDQKICTDYLFVCSSDHDAADDCPFEVR